jgi:hypothetical protein
MTVSADSPIVDPKTPPPRTKSNQVEIVFLYH